MADLSEREKLIKTLEEASTDDLGEPAWEAAQILRSEPERLAAARNEAIAIAEEIGQQRCYQEPTDYAYGAQSAIAGIVTKLRNLKEPQ